MSWFSEIFKRKTSSNSINTNRYFEGLEAFKVGRNLWNDSVLDKSLPEELRHQKTIAALEHFDKAIEKGYEEAIVFLFRGLCLRDLNYDFDALDDFDKCINKDSETASFYYDRAITKQYIYDFEGSLNDFEVALRLSKLDNADTRYWNQYAKETGYNSITQKYELDLYTLKSQKELAEKSEHIQQIMKEKTDKIKRRLQ